MAKTRATQRGLGILKIVVSKVAHKTAGEGRKTLDLRRAVGTYDFTQKVAGVLDVPTLDVTIDSAHACTHRELAVNAGYFHARVVSQEGVSAPTLIGLGAFQQKHVVARVAQGSHDLYGCKAIGVELANDGNALVFARREQRAHLFQSWSHRIPLPLRTANKKAALGPIVQGRAIRLAVPPWFAESLPRALQDANTSLARDVCLPSQPTWCAGR